MAQPAHFGATEPLHIYQDDFFENSAPMISRAPMPAAAKPPRRPLQAANANVVLNPPTLPGAKQSPFKSSSRPSGFSVTPLKPQRNGKLNAVPMIPPNSVQPSTDSLEKKPPQMSKFKTASQKQQGLEGTQPYKSKENVRPTLYPAPPSSGCPPGPPTENFYTKPSGKRVLLEAAPIRELRPAKKAKPDGALPTPESFPPIADDGAKPGHSYANLIGMAILRSPQRRLTLAQIYKWISDTYSFYKPDDAGWQNSIRHNLSLNKHFIKQERPKDDPGKGNYWAIEPGMEYIFLKDKMARKSVLTAENVPVMSTRLELAPPHLPFMSEPILPPQAPQSQISQASLPALPPPPPPSSQPAPVSLLPEVSSDATIPQSDAAALDDIVKTIANDAAIHENEMYSPLPDTLHSSPPIPRHLDMQLNGTPPQMQRPQNSSASKPRSHKRKFASMDDSGYISSLESSIVRPNQREAHKFLTSEAERPRIRRGRAEEEIARLRASSYDSPSKSRSFSYIPVSSSPLRRNNDAGQMLPPLTPATKLKAPPKPPPSVSPGTNLRIHRENVDSMLSIPFAHVAALLPDHNESVTPLGSNLNLNVDEVFYGVDRKGDDFPTANVDFDIFQDHPFGPIFSLSPYVVAQNGSPVKRSVKKQRLDRSHSTSALQDVTGSASHNPFSTSSFLKVPAQNAGMVLETPSKVFDGLPSSPSKVFLQSPSKMPLPNDENMVPWISMDELCGPDLLVEDNDFTGIDMLAGFEKIGSTNAHVAQPPRPPQKPPLGRSYSTTF